MAIRSLTIAQITTMGRARVFVNFDDATNRIVGMRIRSRADRKIRFRLNRPGTNKVLRAQERENARRRLTVADGFLVQVGGDGKIELAPDIDADVRFSKQRRRRPRRRRP